MILNDGADVPINTTEESIDGNKIINWKYEGVGIGQGEYVDRLTITQIEDENGQIVSLEGIGTLHDLELVMIIQPTRDTPIIAVTEEGIVRWLKMGRPMFQDNAEKKADINWIEGVEGGDKCGYSLPRSHISIRQNPNGYYGNINYPYYKIMTKHYIKMMGGYCSGANLKFLKLPYGFGIGDSYYYDKEILPKWFTNKTIMAIKSGVVSSEILQVGGISIFKEHDTLIEYKIIK
jgi:hypothetical protein